jgi:DNA polymerase-3 subunit gamma/tau
MSYQVTARKWRPLVFDDVVGQSHVTNTLRNAIGTNRVAHAYIFSGTRGCGKTTTARILAKVLNCLSPIDNNPDNTCEICQEITSGKSMDIIEIDGASNRGVDEIRNLRDSVRYTPTRGKYKVYIIDEVHMLTKEAFNALLKTLEEPPPHVIFIFATTEVHKVPMTILSRCQRFDFRRISIDEIIGRLKYISSEESITIDEEALAVIAKKGDGSMRDAQSIFDQVRSYCGNVIKLQDVLAVLNAVDQDQFFKVSQLIKEKNLRGGIELVDELMRHGYDLREFIAGLAEHFRNILVLKATGTSELIETSEFYKKRYEAIAKDSNENDLLRLIKTSQDLEQSIRWAAQPRYKLELALLQMIKMDSSVRIEELLGQIGELKKKLSNGTPVSISVPAPPKTVLAPVPSISSSAAFEVKVVGTVNAGMLRSSSYVQPTPTFQKLDISHAAASPSSYSLRDPVFEKPIFHTVQPPQTSQSIVSNQELQARWQEFVDGVTKAKIAVGTILTESRFLDTQHGTVRISCPDDYHLSMLRRNKEFLSETLNKVLGVRMNVELVLHSAHPMVDHSPAATPQEKHPSNGNGQKKENGEHPMLTLLRKELGAEPVL